MFRALSLVCCLALTMSAAVGSSQEVGCQFHEVTSRLLNVSSDQAGEVFIDVLQYGDIACVTRQSGAGGSERVFVAYKVLKSGDRAQINGWARLSYLKPVSKADVGSAASAEKPAPRPAATPLPTAPPTPTAMQANLSPQAPPPVPPATDAEDVRRFDQKIPFGPVPVNGSTLQTLANGVPLFSPLEGLDATQWQLSCSSCHKWDQAKLCDQGKSYATSPKAVLRHPHPYGGSFKIALMRWAQNGCE